MAPTETISSFMLREHGKILALLNALTKDLKTKNAADSFHKLKEAQETHVLAEGKAIMILAQQPDGLKSIILEILREHNQIHDLMKAIGSKVIKGHSPAKEDLQSLLDLMKAHIALEDAKFYPQLDNRLSVREKGVIMSNFRKVILGNIAV